MPPRLSVPRKAGARLLVRAATFNLIRQSLDFGPGRRRVPWYLVVHPGAASVLPILPDGRIVLLRQYRPAVGRWLWEVPCGTLQAGEDPRACAARELAEEAGFAGRLRPLAAFYSAPGFCTERMFCFVADRLRPAPVNRDLDERIRVYKISSATAQRWIARGAIQDAKSLVCLLAYFNRARRGPARRAPRRVRAARKGSTARRERDPRPPRPI